MASNGSSIVPADLYRHFFETFQSTVNVNDPLPVKVGSHSIRDNEVDGEIVDWTLQYLQQKNCPSKLLAHLVSLILWEVRFCISKDDVDAAVNRDKGYEPVKLMQLVTSKINNVCLEFINNQKFESLCTELSFNNRPLHPVSVHAIRNGRRKMEDRHVVIQDLNTICSIRDDVPTSYYAVFDGHAGTDAAFYAASQLHEKLVRNPKFASDPSEALKEAFIATDLAFVCEHENERLKGGTTAVVSLIRGSLLLTAWLGDSQAVLVRDGQATQLVNPHKPDRIDEKERISNLGGEVIFWDGAYRVNGQLAVSRAIGDASYKPYVTAEPDMVAVTLEGHEDFLIIGCDGLWDTIGVDEAAFIVLQYLHHETDISGLSGRLVQAAKQKGSSDNISVIVVFFRQPELIARRPLPPVPTSVQTNNTPSMEQQQEEYEKLAAKWGWNEPQGGAVFDETPWQQQGDGQAQQPQNPFETSNPFGNGNENPAEEQRTGDKWTWNEQSAAESDEYQANAWPEQDGRQTIPETFNGDSSGDYNPVGQSEMEPISPSWPEHDAGHDGDVMDHLAETPEVSDGVTAHWGWKDPEIEALEIEAGRDSEHFAATSVVPLAGSDDVDLAQVRNQYEKVAAKWGRELEQFETNGADPLTATSTESKSDFHLSSDGSTWDQTSGTAQPTGVDWNQYDEELSGQPSLIFVGQSDDSASVEQIISPIEDLNVNETNGPAMTEADRQMWASEENSVTFPPATQQIVEHADVRAPSPPVLDGSLVDEGIAGDEPDLTCSSSSVVESALVECQPDIVSTTVPPSENDPDFHWNLHAPEFEFRATESSPHEQEPQPELLLQSADEEVSTGSSERKLSATELLIRSSNDAQLAVLLAAANDDPDEMEPQELNISPRFDAFDDTHNASNAINESKGDGTIDAEDSEDDWTFSDYRQPETNKEESVVTNNEVADSSSVVELESDSKADVDCIESNCQANDLGNQLEKLTVEDLQAEKANPPSELVQVEAEAVQEVVVDAVQEVVVESVQETESETVQETESEAVQETESESVQETESHSVQETETESAQLMDTEAVQHKEAEVVHEIEVETVPQAETEPVPQAEADAVQQIEEDNQSHAKVEETQSTVISSTVQEPEPTPEPIEAAPEAKEAEVSSTQETIEPRHAESPVSDSATVGSETAALVVTGTAIGVAAVAAVAATATSKAKSPIAKKPTAAATTKKTTSSPAKPASTAAKPAAKEPVKKSEPATRRAATTETKATGDAAKPTRPTKLSPLRKATPAAPSTAPSKPAAAPRVAPAAKTTAAAPKPTVSTTSTTVKKTTSTSTTLTSRTTTTAPVKRVASAPSAAPSTAKTSAPARPATTTSAARSTTTSTSPIKRTAPTATTTKTSTSRLATTATKPTAATNGDVKPKPATTTTRTPVKPTVNGTVSKAAPAPRPTAAAKPASSSRPAPLKSVAGRTATPGKPTGSTASKPAAKVGAATPSRGAKPTATAAATASSPAVAADTPKADDVKE